MTSTAYSSSVVKTYDFAVPEGEFLLSTWVLKIGNEHFKGLRFSTFEEAKRSKEIVDDYYSVDTKITEVKRLCYRSPEWAPNKYTEVATIRGAGQ